MTASGALEQPPERPEAGAAAPAFEGDRLFGEVRSSRSSWRVTLPGADARVDDDQRDVDSRFASTKANVVMRTIARMML